MLAGPGTAAIGGGNHGKMRPLIPHDNFQRQRCNVAMYVATDPKSVMISTLDSCRNRTGYGLQTNRSQPFGVRHFRTLPISFLCPWWRSGGHWFVLFPGRPEHAPNKPALTRLFVLFLQD
jgi:hypothetical protein